MRIIFMGTPDFAVPTLDALVSAGHEVAAVYCQPPRRAGRGKALTPSPVQRRAEEMRIEVRTAVSLKSTEEQLRFAAHGAEIAVVAAYGLILPQPILDAPKHGCLNVHGSILPRWRGAAPIQRAILAGDRETGVAIMQMEAGLDTGPVLSEARTEIGRKTAGELTAEIADMGAALMVEVLADLDAYPPRPQPEDGVTYAAKIDKSEARLDFLISAPQVERQIRAFAPVPGAFFELAGERFRVLAAEVLPPSTPLPPAGGAGGGSASSIAEFGQTHPNPSRKREGLSPGTVIDDKLTIACNPGAIRPTLIQRAGKAAMTPAELLRGYAIPPGSRLA